MNIELIVKLKDRFKWLPDRDTGFRFFEVNNGWYELIQNLCTEIEECAIKHGVKEDLFVSEIKQKMGFLEFYINFPCEGIWEIMEHYRTLSSTICEVCGNTGQQETVYNCIYVLCKTCSLEYRSWCDAKFLRGEFKLRHPQEEEFKNILSRLLEKRIKGQLEQCKTVEEKVISIYKETDLDYALNCNHLIDILRISIGISSKETIELGELWRMGIIAKLYRRSKI